MKSKVTINVEKNEEISNFNYDYIDDITEVTPKIALEIIETRQKEGLFYYFLDGLYVGIDNRTGDAWTEEFESLSECEKWLRQ